MKAAAIIVAGGSGSRMGSSLPKQFMELDGRPMLMRTIETFAKALKGEIILAIPAAYFGQWKELCEKHRFSMPHAVVVGGSNRFESVRSGLSAVSADVGIVLVHDGVRPLVSSPLIEEVARSLETYEAVVPVVPVIDSLRRIEGGVGVAVDRSDYVMVQTPQGFRRELIDRAYSQIFISSFTDDATVVEALGVEIHMVTGDSENIKVTTPKDLALARQIVREHAEV